MLTRFLLCFLFLFMAPAKADAPVTINTPTLVDVNEIEQPKMTKSEILVSNAAVKVVTKEGYGSGTLFILNGHKFVITANHVLGKENEAIVESDCGATGVNAIYKDTVSDIAVLVGNNFCETPILYKNAKTIAGIGTKIEYTSYPNMHSKILLHGEVAGYHESRKDFYVLAQGFAWPGSSGACAFDEDGNFMGIVTGIDVGKSAIGVQLVPDIVWIKPSCLINEQILFAALETAYKIN